MRLLLFMIALAGAGTARADGQCEKNRTFTLPQTTRIPLFSGHETAPDGPYIALIMYDEQARLIRSTMCDPFCHGPDQSAIIPSDAGNSTHGDSIPGKLWRLYGT